MPLPAEGMGRMASPSYGSTQAPSQDAPIADATMTRALCKKFPCTRLNVPRNPTMFWPKAITLYAISVWGEWLVPTAGRFTAFGARGHLFRLLMAAIDHKKCRSSAETRWRNGSRSPGRVRTDSDCFTPTGRQAAVATKSQPGIERLPDGSPCGSWLLASRRPAVPPRRCR
jgi:hypothetical protein